MSYRNLILLFTVFVAASFAPSFAQCKLTCAISGMPPDRVVLQQFKWQQVVNVDSVISDARGAFKISITRPETAIYRLRFPGQRYIFLSVDSGDIDVTATWPDLDDYKVLSGKASKDLAVFIAELRTRLRDLNTLSAIMDSLKNRNDITQLKQAEAESAVTGASFTDYVEQYALTTPYQPNAIFASFMVKADTEPDFMHQFAAMLSQKFPGTKLTKQYLSHK